MINKSILDAISEIDRWCDDNNVEYGDLWDEQNIKSILIFKKDKSKVQSLIDNVRTDNVNVETKKIREGIIVILSVKSLSELKSQGENVDFRNKIEMAITQTTSSDISESVYVNPSELDLMSTAKKIIESQYKPATKGLNRSRQRNKINFGRPAGEHKPEEPQATTLASVGPGMRFENKIASAVNSFTSPTQKIKPFNKSLNEALDGMATNDDIQPSDLFQKFAKALSVLGQNVGTGPLQDQLKKQGINWKKSDDGQSIILYVNNATTNAPQPIARISAETLAKPSDFEAQLLNIMDFAKGDAPGSFKQKQQELQSQEKTVREIAKTMGPQEENGVEQQMKSAAPQQPAVQAAAQQAAMPKTPQPQQVR